MRRTTQILAAACALLALLTATAGARSAPRVPVAHAARLPGTAHVTRDIPAGRTVAFTVGLRGRDPLGLQALSAAVSDRTSPQFGRFLSTRQFAARFGAPQAAIDAIRADLRAQGLTITRTDANHLDLEVAGPASAVERALGTELAEIRLPDGVHGVANTTTATLPRGLAGDVEVIEGLDPASEPRSTLPPRPAGSRRPLAPAHAAPHARRHVASGGPQPCAAASAAAAPYTSGINNFQGFGYTADLIATYYGFSTLYGQGFAGQGQSIALPEGEIAQPGDIAAYAACYGVAPNVAFKNVGTPGTPGSDGEAALDIEQIIGLAPAAHIDVYQYDGGGSLSFATIAEAVSDNKDKVVSISYGACESVFGKAEIQHESKIFQEAAVQGQSVVVSSGDTGSEGCYTPVSKDATTVQVSNYASQPTVLAIGGTSLYAGGTGAAETPYNGANAPIEGVWNLGGYASALGDTAYAATGGGRSGAWAMPTYQSQAAAGLGVVGPLSSGQPCGASKGYCRQVPDVSADGDQLTGYVTYSNDGGPSAWGTSGGTSASAPLWAAFLALANQNPACRGTTLGEVDPYVYAAAGANYAAFFRDTAQPNPSTGAVSNDATGQGGGLFPVGAGYDMSTGLGSPIAGSLAAELCSLRAPVFTVAIGNHGTHKAYLGKTFSFKVRASDSGGLPLAVTVKGLPKGLKFSAKKSRITGRARRRGRYRVSVTAVDGATNAGAGSFVIKVVPKPAPKPKIGGVALRGVAKRHPSLTFTATQRGRKGSKVRSVTIRLPKGLSFGRRHKGIHLSIPHRRGKVRFTAHRSHGALVIHFKRKQSRVKVTVGRGTMFARKAIAHTARKHARRKVKVRINVTDGQGLTGRHTFHLKFKK